VNPEVKQSPALSLTALPGAGGIATRKVAVLIAEGMDASLIDALQAELAKAGAVTRLLGLRLGAVKSISGAAVEADATIENSPSVLFDGVIVPGGDRAAQTLAKSGQALEFLKDQYRHCKTMLVLGAAVAILDKAGIPKALPSGKPDPGLIVGTQGANAGKAFIAALSKHRHVERDQDLPPV
jgi:catalase